MTEYYKPISQVEIEKELIRLTQLLEVETDEFAVVAEDHAKKEARYKKSWAMTYLSKEGSVKERESWSDYENADDLFDVKVADALMRAKREKMHALRTSIDALRTLAANVRNQT